MIIKTAAFFFTLPLLAQTPHLPLETLPPQEKISDSAPSFDEYIPFKKPKRDKKHRQKKTPLDKSPHIPLKTLPPFGKISESAPSFGEYIPFTKPKRDKKSVHQRKTVLNFSYFLDNDNITGKKEAYRKIFVDPPKDKKYKGRRYGTLQIGLEKALLRKGVFVNYGLSLGAGYSRGYGYFSDGTSSSKTKISLYRVPFDAFLSLSIPFTPFTRWGLAAGPSLLGLYQVRSDFDSSESKRHIQQWGYGYGLAARFQVSLGKLFPKSFFSMKSYGIIDTHLNIDARSQKYGGFQEDLEISGQSLGAGFSFDYL